MINMAPEPVKGSISRFAGGKELNIVSMQRYLLPAHLRNGFVLFIWKAFINPSEVLLNIVQMNRGSSNVLITMNVFEVDAIQWLWL
ncbi:protein of unknown function [Legionella hackeliae]|uniref:Uncharacterized protein n=1 Tax=Legionella hackeliae TaxID=449 RepID=A0A0A8USS4_LEGHA|nr:protein of unknown function [Legionella hackeliae]